MNCKLEVDYSNRPYNHNTCVWFYIWVYSTVIHMQKAIEFRLLVKSVIPATINRVTDALVRFVRFWCEHMFHDNLH